MKKPSPLMFLTMFVLLATYITLSPAVPDTFLGTFLFGSFWGVLAQSLSELWFDRLKENIWSVMPIPVMGVIAIYERILAGSATTLDWDTHLVLSFVWLWVAIFTSVLFVRHRKCKPSSF